MVDLYGQHNKINSELHQGIADCIASSTFIGGAAVEQFAENLQALLKVNFVVPCANGTDALQLALMALDLPEYAEVIVPNFTFVAPAEVVALLGYTPVFADVCEHTFNLTAESIEAEITFQTRVIIVVHLFGQAADMTAIMALAEKYELIVIEDTAQSLGSTCVLHDGEVKYAGTMGHIGTTSFFPTKNLGAMGDGGAVFTNDAALGYKLKMLANHGAKEKYVYQMIGINSRLDTIQAAILNVKIKYLDNYLAERKKAASLYFQFLQGVENSEIPFCNAVTPHTFNQFTIKVNCRNDLKKYLQSQQVPSMIYYPATLSSQVAFVKYKTKDSYPIAEKHCDTVLSLPMHTELDEEQIVFICKNVLLGLEKLS